MKVNILKFDHFGRGIGKINDKIIFVDKALKDEVCDIVITKEKKNYYEGQIKEIIQKSKNRQKPICPYYEKCGGCDFLHTTYHVEKEFKINKGKELLGQVDNFYETTNLNYRNKVILHVQNNQIGFYQKGTNNLINIDYCYLLDDKINRVIHDLNNINIDHYHFQNIIIKTNQDKILLNIDEKIDDEFLKHFSYVDNIICQNKVLKGLNYQEEIIDQKKFIITSKAFFQVNRGGLLNINLILKRFLHDKMIRESLDLYSGTSLWGILVSSYCQNITSIEINTESCLNAKENIKNNHIQNLKVINGKVEDYLNQFKNIDLCIIDPPRSGLDKNTRCYLKNIKTKYLIYISCDMLTLKRDLLELKDIYKIIEINLVDMFRATYHVECVTLLCRKTL